MDIHLRIRTRRTELGLTQAQLAALSRISQQHLSLIETGRSAPNLKTLGRIFDALHWDLTPQTRPLRRRLEGLNRYNAWQSSERMISDFPSNLRRCEDILVLRDSLALAHPPVDWPRQAAQWKQFRERLSLIA